MVRAIALGLLFIQNILLTTYALADSSTDPTEVEVVYPQLERRGPSLRLVGTVEAVQHAQLASEQPGRVDHIYVEVGDTVKRGQPLLRLDDSLAKLTAAETASRVEAAKIAVAEARRLLQEVEPLSERQVIAATVVQERRAQLASATATLAQEQATLAYRRKIVDKHTLMAPFAGLVEDRAVSVGEWLTPQSVPFRLVSSDTLRVRIHIPQEYYFSLRHSPDPDVAVHHDKLASPLIGLAIDRLVPVSQQTTRSMPALINLPPASPLVPGMSAEVVITLGADNNNNVWVPVSALKIHPDGGNSLITVVDGKAKRLKVSIVENRNHVALVTGIPQGAPVVSTGVELIKDGMALRITHTREFEL
ncbi:efflux RND transporter periplasmic adaptor subunit [Pseudomaricurvus alkylphenolicus]|jgi:RND family efflux transporter MFP subunit|uniref:efflux RND transporter periplasmic adaptor subunit n=1 Tax=Pseudomaricurvus alkylphenolicus TaxID=1306991 RepID=UPI0014204FF1|nr:efflux RND transporter periplasmic adaptor subunit [Pseudomaricurvus alkylphenolicus]NIB42549.1 efflux RND transporter periplasmic adaptor subunit [Pseudomaricurvus alkylphenolicus]